MSGGILQSAQEIVEYLYKEIRSYSNNQPQEDDITSVICKMNPIR